MDNCFDDSEKLYRAVYPPEIADIFWKKDGSVSSAAFADPKGLSVDRGYFRSDADVILSMKKRFTGHILSLYAKNCTDTGAILRYMPSKSNPYHTEIHGSETTILLSKSQRHELARKSRLIS